MKKEYVLISGGPDSATLAYELARSTNITCLYVNFGQPYLAHELQAARKIAASLNLPLEEIVVAGLSHHFVGLGEFEHVIMREIIEGTYGIAATYVRHQGGGVLYHANIAEDAKDIPGLAEFFPALQKAINCLPGAEDFKIESPYINVPKTEVFIRGLELNVPFELTWSCLRHGRIHCGSCRSCKRRKEAFAAAGIPDPTEYLE